MNKVIYSFIVTLTVLMTFVIPPVVEKAAAQPTCPSGTTLYTSPRGGVFCVNSAGTIVSTITPIPAPGVSAADAPVSEGGCRFYDPRTWWDCIKSGIAQALLIMGGTLLYLAGVLLNFVVLETIEKMSSFVTGLGAIDSGWQAFRDLANIFFVFILIYIAVSTILSLQSSANFKTLTRIIVVALLINFSLFFTKVIIDTSNIVTIQFYHALVPGPATTDVNSGASGVFVKHMFLGSLFDIDPSHGFGPPTTVSDTVLKSGSVFTIGVMGFLFMLIAAFVFFTMAILLIIRFAILIFLMITSPIAFVGSILPKGAEVSSRWWKSLIDQSIFAPAMMMMLWIVAKIMQHPNFTKMLGGAENGKSSFVSAITSGASPDVGIILNFAIIITLLISSLIVAKSAGATGSNMAVNFGGRASFGLAAWAGRNTVGRGSNYLAEKLKDTRFATTRVGSAALRGARGVAGSSMDVRNAGLGTLAKNVGADLGTAGGKGGYTATIKEQVKSREEYAKSLGKKPVFTSKESVTAYQAMESKEKEFKEALDKNQLNIAQFRQSNPNEPLPRWLVEAGKKATEDLKKHQTQMKATISNKYFAVTPQEAYAKNISTQSKTNWWVGQKNKQAAKKIRENQKKEPLKDLSKAFKKASDEGALGEPETGSAVTPTTPATAETPSGGGNATPATPAGGGGGGDHH